MVLLLAACGPKSTAEPAPAPLGDEGAVCGCGEQSGDDCTEVACRPELVCGYGCGIPGCDSTCMTQEKWEQSRTIP